MTTDVNFEFAQTEHLNYYSASVTERMHIIQLSDLSKIVTTEHQREEKHSDIP